MDSTPHKVIANRFEIHHLAGAGGMGAVYRARDRQTGGWVALKLMSDESHSWQESERFLREAQILSELRHPAIVSYVAHGRALPGSGQPFLAMEWLEGESLASRLSTSPLAIPEAALLLRRVAEALAVAHKRGIVHRDIKPSNLFLRNGQLEQVTLLDFGIARRRAAAQSLALSITHGGEILGTPEYMSPEQARGEPEVGPAADIFSLGCVIYQCLSGKPPFRAGNAAAALAKILLETPRPIQDVRKGIPEVIADLLGRMLAKDAARRPADASELLAELSGIGPLPMHERISGSFIIVPPPGPPATTEAEQQLFCVVLAAPGTMGEPTQSRAVLTRDLGRYGAQVEWLLDESVVVTCTGEGSAIDQAARAGRCALLIKEHWPDSEVVLATGRGVSVGQIPMGEVIDRATHLLSMRLTASTSSSEDGQAGAWLDDLSAGLLGRRFGVHRRPNGWVLVSERLRLDQSQRLLGKPTPCVGREQELFALEAHLAGCIENSRASAVLVIGPPGMGKSRLRREFVHRWQSKADPLATVETLIGQADPMASATPYSLLSVGLRRLSGVTGSESPEDQKLKLKRRLGRNLSRFDAQQTVEFLAELCGVPLSANPSSAVVAARRDAWRLQSGILNAFLRFLRAELEISPIVWILEELQWADAMSVELIDVALRELAERPFMVLALARPEVRDIYPRLWGEHRQELVLQGLSRKASERLVRGALKGQIDGELVNRITEQAAGNPLFLEELIRASTEGKGDAVPETVLAMLQARLARLAPEARRILRLASVYGQTFRLSDIGAFLSNEMDERSLDIWLDVLLSGELIEAVGEGDGVGRGQFHFRHALLRDAAYSLLSNEDQVHAHCLAARHLEKEGGAAAQYRWALAALEKQLDSPQQRRRQVELLLELVRVSRGREPIDNNLARLTKANGLLQSIRGDDAHENDELLETHLRYWSGIINYDGNQMQDAIGHFEAVIEQNLRDVGGQNMLMLPASLLGRVYAVQGHFGRALWLLEKLSPLLREDPSQLDGQLVISIAVLGYSLVASGECRRGLEIAQRAVEIAAQRGDPSLGAACYGPYAMALLLAGQLLRAVQELRVGIALAEQSGSLLHLYINLAVCAVGQSRLGYHEPASENMSRSEAVARQLGGGAPARGLMMSDIHLVLRAELALNRGQPEQTLTLVEEGLQLARRTGNIYASALAHRLRAQALSTLGNSSWEAIQESLASSLSSFQAGQGAIEVARTHAVWGTLSCMRGHDEEARSHLRAASEQFVRSGFDAELAAVQAALRTLSS